MGIFNTVRAQFRPSPETVDSQDATEMHPTTVTHADGQMKEPDVEISLKAAQPVDVESGVARVEAAQAVWGKNGKYIIIAG
jgi:hypothetical protein